MDTLRKAVLVDGCRIPFLRAGTGYSKQSAYDLGRMALKGLLHKTQVASENIEHVLMGTVVSEVTTSNVAREIALGVGLPSKTCAYTVTVGCISSNQAITNGVDLIRTGQSNIVVAGGTDTVSDFPLRYQKKFRHKLMAARKYKSIWQYLQMFSGLQLRDLLPEIPDLTEFSVGLSMGQSCDRLAARIGISRQAQDEYALRSHSLAAKAIRDKLLRDEIYPVRLPPDFKTISQDNGVREDASLEKLQALNPAFVKKYGTVTAGNASFLTDGASVVLLMAEEVAKSLGYSPKVALKAFTYTAHDSLEDLLLGPAWSIPKVLDMAGLKLADISVFELHEAFAGQVLAILACLDSARFAQEKLGKTGAVGAIPLEKLNTLGGSLSLGHPFGATGARLVTTASNRLVREGGQFALVASCAAGAMANAIILERLN